LKLYVNLIKIAKNVESGLENQAIKTKKGSAARALPYRFYVFGPMELKPAKFAFNPGTKFAGSGRLLLFDSALF
jgi:hypothetical protein